MSLSGLQSLGPGLLVVETEVCTRGQWVLSWYLEQGTRLGQKEGLTSYLPLTIYEEDSLNPSIEDKPSMASFLRCVLFSVYFLETTHQSS